MIAIVNYGMGNLRSVQHALEMVGAEVRVTTRPEELHAAERLVLPGVGAFGACVQNLRASGLVEALTEEVLHRGKPLLGICLGMQVLARVGYEMGEHQGLGWIPAAVQRFEVEHLGFKVPHVGWNEVIPQRDTPLFHGLQKDRTFYFVHSYYLVPDTPEVTLALCDYGGWFTAAILRDNIFACQFHPEKSQHNGLRLLENFLSWNP